MRKQLLGVFLPLLVLVLMAAAAETQSTATESASRATLQKVAVVHGEDGVSVEITGRGQLRPELSAVDSPARLVVDLPATVMATSQSHIGVGSDGVKGVRIGMDGQTPPNTRVVIDLAQACRYQLLAATDNKFTVKLYTAATAAKTTTNSTAVSVANPAVAQVPSPKKELAMSTP
ncbi:MAG TPA: AMIN domain-containing protein, partial [Terriglobales bacterium]|nr:AMIN domain-containing protein [Terriglobales bacterium]